MMKKNRKKGLLYIISAVILLGVIIWVFLPSPVEVDLQRAQKGPLMVTVDEEGETRAKDRFVVSSPVSGRLTRIELKEGDRWRTVSDLRKDEKQEIMEHLVTHLDSLGVDKDAASGLIGKVYTLNKEDHSSPLRDAREFGSLLNACGRMDRAGLGIAICMGDRASAFSEAQQVLIQYRKALSEGLKWLNEVPDRVEECPSFILIKGEDVIDEKIIGAISTILTTSRTYGQERPIIAITRTKENTVKVSARGNEFLISRGLNLGEIMQKASEMVSGSGGGHNIAAGAQIPLGKEDAFLMLVKEMIDKALQVGEKAES